MPPGAMGMGIAVPPPGLAAGGMGALPLPGGMVPLMTPGGAPPGLLGVQAPAMPWSSGLHHQEAKPKGMHDVSELFVTCVGIASFLRYEAAMQCLRQVRVAAHAAGSALLVWWLLLSHFRALGTSCWAMLTANDFPAIHPANQPTACPQGVGTDIEVPIIEDLRQRFIMDSLAVYVVKDGAAFEQVGWLGVRLARHACCFNMLFSHERLSVSTAGPSMLLFVVL
jgi:hypothetical protein